MSHIMLVASLLTESHLNLSTLPEGKASPGGALVVVDPVKMEVGGQVLGQVGDIAAGPGAEVKDGAG